MRAIWSAIFAASLLLATGAGTPVWAQSLTFPFACELDMNLVSEANLDRANVPQKLRENIYLATGEKRCTFSNNPVTQIRCETTVEDWPDPSSVNIRSFEEGERCRWFLEEEQCELEGEVIATNQSLIIEPVDADTARVRLICSSRFAPQ